MSQKSFRQSFCDGEPLRGFQVTSVSPHWPKHLRGEVDFVFIDGEHHCFSREQVAWLCLAYRSVGIAPVVRVLQPDAALVRAAMDDGADTVVVPYVETLDQARAVTAAAKLRPIQGERAHAAMRDEPLDRSRMAVSRQHCGDVGIIIQIESVQAVDRCDELLSIHLIDGIMVGPYDLTASLGCLGDHSNDLFQQAAREVAQQARELGMGAGIYFAESPEKEAMARRWGYNLVISGCDWSLMRESLRGRQNDSQ